MLLMSDYLHADVYAIYCWWEGIHPILTYNNTIQSARFSTKVCTMFHAHYLFILIHPLSFNVYIYFSISQFDSPLSLFHMILWKSKYLYSPL